MVIRLRFTLNIPSIIPEPDPGGAIYVENATLSRASAVMTQRLRTFLLDLFILIQQSEQADDGTCFAEIQPMPHNIVLLP